MRQLIYAFIMLFCLQAVSLAAGNVQVDIRNGYGDTLFVGIPTTLMVYLANDTSMAGFQIPLTFSSPDGVTVTWNAQLVGWGAHKYVTHNSLSRIEPPAAVFDLTAGITVIERYLPDKIGVGTANMFSPGMAPGPLEHILSLHITPNSSVAPGEVQQLCVDITQWVGLWSLSFIELGGYAMDPTFLDANGDGTWCFPVVHYACKSSPGEVHAADEGLVSMDCGDPLKAVPYGQTYERTIMGEDPSDCGYSLAFSIAQITDTLYHAKTPVIPPTIDAETGFFQWSPTEADTGLWVFGISLSSFGDPQACAFTIRPYLCGDADGDHQITAGDAIYIVNRIFRNGPAIDPVEAADANGDGRMKISDAIYIINYIFREGPSPCGR